MTRTLRFNQSSKYPFDLDKVLYTGQDFRWCEWKGDWHSGVLKGNLIHIRQINSVLEYKSHPDQNLDEMLRSYFRLNDPIDKIYDDISCRDAKVKKLVRKYPWLRVLRQPDPWECVVAYICSPQGIPWIEGNLEDIAQELGDPIELEGMVRFTFPSPEKVWRFGPRVFGKLQFRYPGISKYIISAAERICTHALELGELKCLSYAEATRQLMDKHSASHKPANGIGPKVADCIALFALDKMEAFPVDRHVWNAVKCHFPAFQHRDEPTDSQKKKIVCWAQDRFEDHAGHANQFLFYWKLEESLRKRDKKPLHEQCHPCPGA